MIQIDRHLSRPDYLSLVSWRRIDHQGSLRRLPRRGLRAAQGASAKCKIPAGIDDSMRVRLPGEGEPSTSGGPRGDCYVFVTVTDHPLFTRDGQNLIVRMPIGYAQAALGARSKCPRCKGRTS